MLTRPLFGVEQAARPVQTSRMDTLGRARRVLSIETNELERLAGRLDRSFTDAVNLLRETVERRGKIVVLGVGKSGHIGGKIAATLTSTGAPSVVLDSLNALHGDLGLITNDDFIVFISNSGETKELIQIADFTNAKNISSLLITANDSSSLAQKINHKTFVFK